ncbi:SIS domain-containing protein [Aureimonas jatrophae]|uniref:Galactosamine 6-phosphate isomerase AgaS n=1 Tax=Aureimonas jatrophae TaxID=1166073 RepID=A0A1H0JPC6_9HYPH|nr:SIS domain-containing protein [Aureimonas jatrophae]MBB3951313.1 tagatose-6-phosphate ketose/aldose isomerase [Aureimonas jatrophae]SDO45413.1 galactosamine 6-phosphate isomerase AgaS [Aureimonas jatrophae]
MPTFDLLVPPGSGGEHTAREIAQQPSVWRTVAAQSRADEATRRFLELLVADASRRIVLTGAGTSAFGGRMVAPLLARALGRPVEAIATTDIVARPRELMARDDKILLVSFARSGNSPESVAAAELVEAVTTDCRHLVVTCAEDGQLARRHAGRSDSRVVLMPAETNDQGFAMTSSITSMMLAVLGAFAPSFVEDGSIDQLARSTEEVLSRRPAEAQNLMARRFDRIVYLGSGILRAMAEEAALKILELTGGQTLSYHDTPLGFRHGPKSLLDDRTLVVVLVSSDPYARLYDLDILAEMRDQLGDDRVVAFSPEPLPRVTCPVWEIAAGSSQAAGDWPLVLPYLAAAQLIALQASLAAGRTPDNPFPSGEVNRVVQGVTIHPLGDGTH